MWAVAPGQGWVGESCGESALGGGVVKLDWAQLPCPSRPHPVAARWAVASVGSSGSGASTGSPGRSWLEGESGTLFPGGDGKCWA